MTREEIERLRSIVENRDGLSAAFKINRDGDYKSEYSKRFEKTFTVKTIVALLDEIERLERELEEVHKILDDWHDAEDGKWAEWDKWTLEQKVAVVFANIEVARIFALEEAAKMCRKFYESSAAGGGYGEVRFNNLADEILKLNGGE